MSESNSSDSAPSLFMRKTIMTFVYYALWMSIGK